MLGVAPAQNQIPQVLIVVRLALGAPQAKSPTQGQALTAVARPARGEAQAHIQSQAHLAVGQVRLEAALGLTQNQVRLVVEKDKRSPRKFEGFFY